MEQSNKLKVLIVCNNAFVRGNGLCTAVQALRRRLRDAGVDARLMAAVNADAGGPQPDFPLEHFKFPFFEPLIYANGFRYAKSDNKRIQKAVEWADVVHVQEAFTLEVSVVNIARKLGKVIVGTFHLYPENVTANLRIAKITPISNAVLMAWRNLVFNKCSDIQCPTEFVKQHLAKHGFTSRLWNISNGIEIDDNRTYTPVKTDKPYKILCIGRLSNEKGQITLLKAMRYSRYAKDIELQFAGRGPFYKKYKKYADKLVREGVLSIPPQFGFYNKEQLKELSSNAYLYIHCAWIEVEGLSCIEALREGAVPLIAKGMLSATPQFALDERSIFPIFDSKALAEKIDWWIEHPQERNEAGAAYMESARKYEQKHCTQQLIKMYEKALER